MGARVTRPYVPGPLDLDHAHKLGAEHALACGCREERERPDLPMDTPFMRGSEVLWRELHRAPTDAECDAFCRGWAQAWR